MRCPRCHRDAPVIQRGLMSYCTVCGAERLPLTTKAVNLSGEPSRIGGCLAKTVGSLVLAVGLSLALFMGLLLIWLFPASIAAYVASVPLAVLTLIVGALLLFGGKKLDESGQQARRTTQEQALRAVAAANGGWVSARRAAHALSTTVDEADSLLTEMAKRRPDDVAVELTDEGEIKYRFSAYARHRPRVRIDADAAFDRGGVSAVDDVAAAPSADEDFEAEEEAANLEARERGAARRR
jgi:hypothetical protein